MKQCFLVMMTLLLCYQVEGQNDFFTEMEKVLNCGENIEFIRAGLSQEPGGYASLEGRTGNISIKMTKNTFDKYEGFIATFTDDKKEYINSQPCPLQIDHYTHPAAYSRDKGNSHYVMVEGVLYHLMYVKGDFSEFDIVEMYVPKLAKKDIKKFIQKKEDKKKKKKSLSERLKEKALKGAIKFTEAVGGNPFVMEQSKIQHAQRIREYMKKMRKIQAANPYSAATKTEIAALKEECKKKSAEIQKFNEDYMNSDEYKEIENRNAFFEGKKAATARNSVTFKNVSNKIIGIGTAMNLSTTINGNSTYSLDCGKDYYIYQANSTGAYTKGAKVYSANSNCEGTVEVQ